MTIRVLQDTVCRMVLAVAESAVEEDTSWLLSDGGDTPLLVPINDEEFLRSIDVDDPLVADDVLICEVRVLQWLDDDGLLCARRSIERVVETRRRHSGGQKAPHNP